MTIKPCFAGNIAWQSRLCAGAEAQNWVAATARAPAAKAAARVLAPDASASPGAAHPATVKVTYYAFSLILTHPDVPSFLA